LNGGGFSNFILRFFYVYFISRSWFAVRCNFNCQSVKSTTTAIATAKMTKAQILQQAGITMVSQANSIPNGVLSLLQG
jgi:hypothetical protein